MGAMTILAHRRLSRAFVLEAMKLVVNRKIQSNTNNPMARANYRFSQADVRRAIPATAPASTGHNQINRLSPFGELSSVASDSRDEDMISFPRCRLVPDCGHSHTGDRDGEQFWPWRQVSHRGFLWHPRGQEQ
jgi:hypothetical protein